jgi:hypothetical protein
MKFKYHILQKRLRFIKDAGAFRKLQYIAKAQLRAVLPAAAPAN